MGRRCCVPGCQSTSRLPEHQGVTYHTFPLDPIIRGVWLRNTKCPADKQITKSVLVCSRHFRRLDFNPIKNGKYLLKQRVFPTVFPWGKVDPEQVLADQQLLRKAAIGQVPNALIAAQPGPENPVTKDRVAATVAQIFAKTAEFNVVTGNKTEGGAVEQQTETSADEPMPLAAAAVLPNPDSIQSSELPLNSGFGNVTSPIGYKYEPLTVFNPGSRVEAQDFDGIWHAARVVEVDNDEREVLIRFERSGRSKTSLAGTEEWVSMNSNRLRHKVSTKPIPSFEMEEKCLARWSGPRKFPATVKKIIGNDTYEVLFDDGFTKTVRALHMNKINEPKKVGSDASDGSTTPIPNVFHSFTPTKGSSDIVGSTTSPSAKKRSSPGSRKDWPLLDLSKLDLASLNLPEIPQDGEWTCHWVNDQPIGKEGYLLVGEHRKPTVVVEDWRLPSGWIKHMYQRSNVLGKWDVILVSPSGKRFRSKSDLKTYLEEKGESYNPDIYDFSIHRRRAKDINAYAYTPDYTPPQPSAKQNALDSSLDISMDEKAAVASCLEKAVLSKTTSQYLETPIASATPPMELMTSPTIEKMSSLNDNANDSNKNDTTSGKSTPTVERNAAGTPLPPLEDGYVYIGGLKIQLVDNLFRCPDESCSKHFRKENHLQIHVKHYHRDLAKLLGSCPKMLELAAKRTHTISADITEPTPKNQIPNQQFFAKLHQQDLEQSRSHKRNLAAAAATKTDTEKSIISAVIVSDPVTKPKEDSKSSSELNKSLESTINTNTTSSSSSTSKGENIKTTDSTSPRIGTPTSTNFIKTLIGTSVNDSAVNSSLEQSMNSSLNETASSSNMLKTSNKNSIVTNKLSHSPQHSKDKLSIRHRFASSIKKDSGSRRSNRQRITRRFLTAAEAQFSTSNNNINNNASNQKKNSEKPTHTDSNSTTTSDHKKRNRHHHSHHSRHSHHSNSQTPSTPLSSVDSPVTADSMDIDFNNSSKSLNENSIDHVKIEKMKKTEIINCLCSYGEEDGLMIQCELCLCWQHGTCNGIDKEDEVPDPYFCYICRHPNKAREKMRFLHDQHWLFEGKLPTANYHSTSDNLQTRFDFLKKTHRISGNLVNLKTFMHTLNGKINIGNNRSHPKLYLWATDWDPKPKEEKYSININNQTDNEANVAKGNLNNDDDPPETKKIKLETDSFPNAPKPEAAIDPEECQHRLHKHVRYQQKLISERLDEFENEINALEEEDELKGELKDDDYNATKELLSAYMKDLGILRKIARINRVKHEQKILRQQQPQQQPQQSLQPQGNVIVHPYTQLTGQPSLQTIVS